MADEAAAKKAEVNPLKYIEQRVATAFPALVGPKFTAKYATETNEYVMMRPLKAFLAIRLCA
jgi:hypothetical protein